MTSARSLDQPEPGRPAQRRNLIRSIPRDFIGVAVLALVSLAAGVAMNRFSPQPLYIVYQTPEQRFDAELTTLVTAPPFKIAPAAIVALPEFRSAVETKSALILDARHWSSLSRDMCRVRSILREKTSRTIIGSCLPR
jgi:hypothetical protein